MSRRTFFHELRRGDKLCCINSFGYLIGGTDLSEFKNLNGSSAYKVLTCGFIEGMFEIQTITDDKIVLTSGLKIPREHYIDYFKLCDEVSIEDYINEATIACERGILDSVVVSVAHGSGTSVSTSPSPALKVHTNHERIFQLQKGYIKTFMVVDEECVEDIPIGAKITLANGINSFVEDVGGEDSCSVLLADSRDFLEYIAIKGSCITYLDN